MLRRCAPFLLALLLVAAGFTQLTRYGVTWDEALGDFFFGQRYLSFFTSFDSRYLDFDHDPYPAGTVPNLRTSGFRHRPWEYWPFANVLAAATSRVLSNDLGLLDPFDGFHAFNLLAGAALLILLYRFLEREYSTRVAAIAVLLLYLMPHVFVQMMANIKDFPEMVFFAATLIAGFFAYERASPAGMIGAGVLWGLALATKANAWFIPFVALAFVIMRGVPSAWDQRKLLAVLVAAGVAGVAVMFASWPWLWAAPVSRLRMNLTYISMRGLSSRSTMNPWGALWFTTPPVVMLLALSSLPLLVPRIRQRHPATLLLVAWVAVVGIRISAGANFDGVRHFLEIFPPIAALAGIAAVEYTRRAPVLLAIPIAFTAYATIASHPFETAYWNAFIGGVRGAQARGIPEATDYWAGSYRLGIRWLNADAERNSLLIVPIAGQTVQLVAPLWLRPDIHFVWYPPGGDAAAAARRLAEVRSVAAHRPLYVMFITRRNFATELDRDCMRRLEPVRAWTLDGVPVLLIYRYRP